MAETERPKRRLPQYFLVTHKLNGDIACLDRRTTDGERAIIGFSTHALAEQMMNSGPGAAELGCRPTRFDYPHLAAFLRNLLELGVEVLLFDWATADDGAWRFSIPGVRIEEALECMAMLAGEDGTFDEDLVLDLGCDLYHLDLQAEPGRAS